MNGNNEQSLVKRYVPFNLEDEGAFYFHHLIVALGIGFFAGIKATAPDMKETANRYFSATT